MRLVDADKLIDNLEWLNENDYILFDEVKETVKNTTTVKAIPLDKPFCKMVYGDYVVYNKKWLVNHLQTEWNILQGKEYKPAIPIEWIEKWGWKNGMSESMSLRVMIEDWEKETALDKQIEQWEFDDDMDWQTIQREHGNEQEDRT